MTHRDTPRTHHGQTGFRGLTSYLFVRASCRKDNFSSEGFLARNRGRAGYTPVDSDVVCFVSSAADDVGHHEALMTAADLGSFPPNTLYRLVEVIAAGAWEAPGGEVRPQRRLLVVKATYLSTTNMTVKQDGCNGCNGCNRCKVRQGTYPSTTNMAVKPVDLTVVTVVTVVRLTAAPGHDACDGP